MGVGSVGTAIEKERLKGQSRQDVGRTTRSHSGSSVLKSPQSKPSSAFARIIATAS